MKLTLYRDNKGLDSTLGRLCIGEGISEYHFCYTLEDQWQAKKVDGETRIPAGTYEIKLRRGSPVSNRYDEAYSHIDHDGMLWLQDVPNFTWVYMHTGVNHEHTEACILVGCGASIDLIRGGGTLSRSREAYEALYKIVHPVLLAGEKVFIQIKDEGVK